MNDQPPTILLLGSGTDRLLDDLAESKAFRHDGPPDLGRFRAVAPDVIVSYGYRHLLPPAAFEIARVAAINLHVSLLPWNRGADPNLWSFLEDTPKGVTIHDIDAGLDTGHIIAQQEVTFSGGETLASSYARLDTEIRSLFREVWRPILEGRAPRTPQPSGGSLHRVADRAAVEHLLRLGWDTPVAELAGVRRPPA